jgi:hexosaminidase
MNALRKRGKAMFFTPKLYEKRGLPIGISKSVRLSGEVPKETSFLQKMLSECILKSEDSACQEIEFCLGFSQSAAKKIRAAGFFLDSEDAFCIFIGKKTKICAQNPRGFCYALAAIKNLLGEGNFCRGFLFDAPLATLRGYRAFLPKRSNFSDFYEMVDFLAEYRFNAIILEIGGAMEYERHPEINTRWAEFAKETRSISGRADQIQNKTYPWQKNSIHTDNAGGDILTKKECRALAAYCRSRGLEVIPECPTLSHSDYLCMAHPQIREREGDLHPDAYCPLHPDTYPLVFDVLEEVIEVFAPKVIHIGHDELYSVGVCPRCKGKSPSRLYADDIKKLHGFLAERGIRTMMWGEKLLNARVGGKKIGGAAHGKGLKHVPALWPCRDQIPRDVIMLHWYYIFNPAYDKIYHERSFETYYGNLEPMSVAHWNKRRDAGIRGGFVSNWGSYEEEYMQRNQQYFSLVGAAMAFWNPDFEAMGEAARLEAVLAETYRLKRSKVHSPILIRHTTPHKIEFDYFYDGAFIEDEKYMLGEYILSYTDGTKTRLPVKFGTHIGSAHFEDYLHEEGFRELSYGTLPLRHRDGWVYECPYENPFPEKKVLGIRYQSRKGKEDIEVELVSFEIPLKQEALRSGKTHRAGEAFAWDGGKTEK